jgi:hypothetical protein
MLFDLIEQLVGFFIRNGSSALVTGATASLLNLRLPPMKESMLTNVLRYPIGLVEGATQLQITGFSASSFGSGAFLSFLVQPVADAVRKVSGTTTISTGQGLQQYGSLVTHGITTYAAYRLVMAGVFDTRGATFTADGGLKWVAALGAGDIFGATFADGIGSLTGLDYDYI